MDLSTPMMSYSNVVYNFFSFRCIISFVIIVLLRESHGYSEQDIILALILTSSHGLECYTKNQRLQ